MIRIILMFAMLFAMGTTVPAQERNTIYFGPDAEVLTLRQPRWQNCARRCDNNNKCVGWTYIETVNQCRLKEAIWLRSENGCCVSGERQNAGGGQQGGGGGQQGGGGGASGADNVRITSVLYNARNRGRGACIRTSPGIPRDFRGWACLWKDHPNYAEMDRLLNEAHIRNMDCQINWSDRARDRLAEIKLVQCSMRR